MTRRTDTEDRDGVGFNVKRKRKDQTKQKRCTHNFCHWCGHGKHAEEEPRRSDVDAVELAADEQMVNTNAIHTARPHRRPSPGLDESPALIKPIPRGSSFFVFSHTNRLAMSTNGQTNPNIFFLFFSLSLFFFLLVVCVCVRVVCRTRRPAIFGFILLLFHTLLSLPVLVGKLTLLENKTNLLL